MTVKNPFDWMEARSLEFHHPSKWEGMDFGFPPFQKGESDIFPPPTKHYPRDSSEIFPLATKQRTRDSFYNGGQWNQSHGRGTLPNMPLVSYLKIFIDFEKIVKTHLKNLNPSKTILCTHLLM